MPHTSRPDAASGFTLIELIVVVALLAILGGVVVSAYDGVDDRTREQSTRLMLEDLRDALVAFHHDVGYLPRQGRAAAGGGLGEVVPRPPHTNAWFMAEVNWIALFENPFTNTGEFVSMSRLADYSIAADHGWNGPYLEAASRSTTRPTGSAEEAAKFPSGWVTGEESRTNSAFTDINAIMPTVRDLWGTPIRCLDFDRGFDEADVAHAPRIESAGPDRSFTTSSDNLVQLLFR